MQKGIKTTFLISAADSLQNDPTAAMQKGIKTSFQNIYLFS